MTYHANRLLRCTLGAAALALSAAAMAAPSLSAAVPKDLVGTWRLVSFEDVEDGKIVRAFGEKPVGLFVYTPEGHVIIQIANPANPACYAPGKSPGEGKWTIERCLRAAPNKCRRCWTIPSLTGAPTPSIWPLAWSRTMS